MMTARTGYLMITAVLLSAAVVQKAVAAEDAAQVPMDHLQLWLMADVGVECDGPRVLRWKDQSKHGNDARAELQTSPVWIKEGISGKPVIRFDGKRSCMAIAHQAGLNASGGFTVFCVFRFSDGFRIAQKKDRSGGLAQDAWFLAPQPGLGVAGRYSGKHPFFTPGIVHLQTSTFDATGGAIRIFSRGELVKTVRDVPAQTPNSDPVRIGSRDNPGGTEGYLLGDVAELLIYNTALPDAARKQVEDYLRKKYAIARLGEEAVTITRLIPGNEKVTVHWVRRKTTVAPSDIRYQMHVKFRSAPWDDAMTVGLHDDKTPAVITGFLNNADYSVQVIAEQISTGKRIGMSAERLVAPATVPGVVIDYLHKDDSFYMMKGRYIGSPSIARLSDGSLVASHDLFGGGSWNFSRIFRSEDNGETWRHAADLNEAFWGKLFVHNSSLYMLACRERFGDVVLHHSPDGGRTWIGPVVLASGTYHKAPVPVVVHRGRLWTCVERKAAEKGREFQSVALSVATGADLLKPENWTVSEPLPYDPAWAPKGWNVTNAHISEGNAVVDPQGNLLNILRYNATPYFGKAVVLNIAEGGKSLSFNRVIDFYGARTKFTIRRHPETGIYWSLVNRVTHVPQPSCRNVLTLVSSPDLDNWTLVRDVLRDDREIAPKYTGFQYVDWLFDDKDIIFVCRMGYNGPHNFHDANHLTFHRVKNFAEGPRFVGP